MLRLSHVLGLGLVALVGCNRSESEKTAPVASASAAVSVAPAPPAPPKPKIANQWGKSAGFKAPESVVHDAQNDLYLVSNVDGKPLDVDGKGFISKVAPVGNGVELKWIESGKNKVVLNAPKGMAIAGDTLWVADIDTVRAFDRTTGAPTAAIKIPEATFLNDVAVTPDGRVLVTDTGLRMAKDGGLEPTGGDAVYAIDKDRKVTTLSKRKELGGPNGIIAPNADDIWVVTAGTGQLYRLDVLGKATSIKKLPRGTLDGIAVGKTDYFVSSWDANAIYRGKPEGAFEVFVEDVKSPADVMFDKKRNRLVVPLMTEDELRAYEIP